MKDFTILYGSQTGTAQYFAESLYRSSIRRSYKISISSLDKYPITELPSEKYVIFVVSTTGQGDPPDSMKQFWKFLLLKDLPSDVLNDVNFTIFGLGDKIYPLFNAMARKLYNRLIQLGAKCFFEKGLGDESSEMGIYGEFEPWEEKLWVKMKDIFQKDNILRDYEMNFKVELFNQIEYIYNEEIDQEYSKPISSIEFKENKRKNQSFKGKMIGIENLCSENEHRVIKIDVETPDFVTFNPGDIISVYPRNSIEICKKLAQRLNVNLEDYIRIEAKNEGFIKNIPKIIKIQDLFECFLDIQSYPSRYFFEVASYYTKNELHKEKLEELGKGKKQTEIDEYYNYCVREKRNVYEILFDFNSVEMPISALIETIQLIKPRDFSISSYYKYTPKIISITIALVEYKTRFGRKIEGICSKYLYSIKENEYIVYWLKHGSLQFNENSNALIISPGTGIAPFISLFQKILYEKNQINNKKNIIKLFFGCRWSDKDFLYKDFLHKLVSEQIIEINTAFSRDQDKKIYVQHKIIENKKELSNFLVENIDNVYVFICGNSKFMPQQVKNSLNEIIKDFYDGNNEKAQEFWDFLTKNKRFQIETW